MPVFATILPMTPTTSDAPRERHTVAVAVAAGNHPFEPAVACEVFGLERPELDTPWYRFVVCAEDGRVDLGCFTLETPHGFDELAAADTVIVPACPPEQGPSPALVDALRTADARGARLVSYCSGAFALAAAGALDGHRATTHWLYADRLAAQYPAISVLPDVLYVDDGRVLTSAGTSAAIDLSLYIVRLDYGSKIANAVARRMVVPPHRDGGQAQFLDKPVPETADPNGLAPTLDWMVDNLDQPLTIEQMAEHALMSTRTFMRRFRAATGMTPQRWLALQRTTHARRLLESTDASIDRVAQAAGFGSAANLRVHFQRTVGTAPTSYRRAFGASRQRATRPATRREGSGSLADRAPA
jgi:AraC family transcriptional regulator, transcriptional activator FtrA